MLVDENGNVATATAPTTDAWTLAKVAHKPLTAVACPSASLCVAVGVDGTLATSTDPTGGSSAWNVVTVGGAELESVTCPSAALCVATDNAGNVIASTNPTGGTAAWTAANIDETIALSDVSCPTTSFCAAADGAGNVFTATAPTGGSGAWKKTAQVAGAAYEISSISCASDALCVAAGKTLDRALLVSTSPAGDANQWTAVNVSAVDVSCPTVSFCGGAAVGGVVTSADPTAGPAAWTYAAVPAGSARIACTSSSFCAMTGGGDVAASTNPAGGTAAWATTLQADGFSALNAIACPALLLCLAGDRAGDIRSSADPGASTGWDLAMSAAGAVNDISCASTALCVAGDDAGGLSVATNPLGGPGAWSTTIPFGDSVTGVACPSEHLCVAVDGSGHVLTATDPVGGDWSSSEQVDTQLTALACPAPSLCVAVGGGIDLVVSTDPAGGAGAWKKVQLQDQPLSVACASASLCVVGEAAGEAAVSLDPADPASWTVSRMTDAPVSAVACPSASLCAATDAKGRLHASANPTGGGDTWSSTATFDFWSGPWDRPRSDVACPALGVCIAVGEDGARAVGTATGLPVNVTQPAITGSGFSGRTLSCSQGDWSGTPTAFSYEWLRVGTAISGATGSAYTLGENDRGRSVSCRVAASNALGTARATAPPLRVSGLVPPTPISKLELGAGGTFVGTPITCFGQIFVGSQPVTLVYEWLRDGSPIAGAALSRYTIAADDVGHLLACRVTATNTGGSTTLTSDPVFVAPPPVASHPPVAITVGAVAKRVRLKELLAKGLPVTASCSGPCTVRLVLRVNARTARRLHLAKNGPVTIAARKLVFSTGKKVTVRLVLSAKAKKHLRKAAKVTVELVRTGTVASGQTIPRTTTSLALRR